MFNVYLTDIVHTIPHTLTLVTSLSHTAIPKQAWRSRKRAIPRLAPRDLKRAKELNSDGKLLAADVASVHFPTGYRH